MWKEENATVVDDYEFAFVEQFVEVWFVCSTWQGAGGEQPSKRYEVYVCADSLKGGKRNKGNER